MNPCPCNKSFFSKFFHKCFCSLLCFIPVIWVLIILNSFSKSSYFSFSFNSFLFSLSKELWIFNGLFCHNLCYFRFNLSLFLFLFFIFSIYITLKCRAWIKHHIYKITGFIFLIILRFRIRLLFFTLKLFFNPFFFDIR